MAAAAAAWPLRAGRFASLGVAVWLGRGGGGHGGRRCSGWRLGGTWPAMALCC